MEDKKKVARTKSFIDRKQQLKFCVELVLYALVLPLLLLTFLSVEPLASWLVKGDAAGSRAAVVELIQICLQNWWVIVLAVLITAITSVLFSNRIFGPLHRLGNALEAAMAGESTELYAVRKGDYLRVFSETLGRFVKWTHGEGGDSPSKQD